MVMIALFIFFKKDLTRSLCVPYSVCSVYSVVKQPVLKLGLPVTFVHYPKVGIKGIVM